MSGDLTGLCLYIFVIYPVVFSYVNYYLSHLRREQQFDLIHHQMGNRLKHASGPVRFQTFHLLHILFDPYGSALRSKFFGPLDYFFYAAFWFWP